jgi:hypothetical protein
MMLDATTMRSNKILHHLRGCFMNKKLWNTADLNPIYYKNNVTLYIIINIILRSILNTKYILLYFVLLCHHVVDDGTPGLTNALYFY